MTSSSQQKRVGLSVLIAAFLAGCGGGEGGAPTSTAIPPPANNPPTISGSPATVVTEGQPYSFTPSANDADSDLMTFSVLNPPPWASFDTDTGTLAGTPATVDIGTTIDVTVSVSDGADSASLMPFDLEVRQLPPPGNTPPTIAGVPVTTVIQDQPYAFTPTANDADGDTLTFSIAPQPAWASFDRASGSLTGTPMVAHVGTTFGVTISVTDGFFSASLASFDLEVQQTPLGSATVSWDVPVTNADGSPLTDLDRYRIHYGTSSQNYSLMIEVSDPNATDVTINGLRAGTWFFAVQAVDRSDNASAFSTEVSKVIIP